jgi:hypothetical protein
MFRFFDRGDLLLSVARLRSTIFYFLALIGTSCLDFAHERRRGRRR